MRNSCIKSILLELTKSKLCVCLCPFESIAINLLKFFMR